MSEGHPEGFIQEMREKLRREKAELEQHLGRIAHKGEEGGFEADFPDYGRDEEENANEVADAVALSATTEAMEARLKEVEEALQRIEQGTYGFTSSGERIPQERLRANPAATTTVTGAS